MAEYLRLEFQEGRVLMFRYRQRITIQLQHPTPQNRHLGGSFRGFCGYTERWQFSPLFPDVSSP